MSQLQNCSVKIFKKHSSRHFTQKGNIGYQLGRIEKGGGWELVRWWDGGVDVYEELKL